MTGPSIEDLVRDLASDDTNVVQDAGFALRYRLEAVESVPAAIPTLWLSEGDR